MLGKHSGRHAFGDTLAKMGLHVQGDALNQAFVRFKELADRKVEITEADLEAIVAEELGTGAVHRYSIVSLDFHGGTQHQPTAEVVLADGDGGTKVEATGSGNGMIDAAFDAIAAATGVDEHGRRLQGGGGHRRRRRARRHRHPARGRRPAGDGSGSSRPTSSRPRRARTSTRSTSSSGCGDRGERRERTVGP